MVVREDRYKAIRPEATGLHPMFLSTLVLHSSVTGYHSLVQARTYIAERELSEVPLEVVIAVDRAILSHDK